MAKFCSWCGEALEPGARYCPECGARVLESVKVDGSADSVDPMRGFDIVGGEALPADKTIKIDRDRDPAGTDTLVLPTDNAQKRFSIDDSPKKSKAALVACIAVIVVLLAVIGVLFWMQSNAGQGGQQTVSIAEEDSSQDQAGDDGGVSESKEEPSISDTSTESESLSDDEIFARLDEAYNRLSSYDDRIADCVEDFNGLFLARSMDEREAAKSKADDLLSALNEELAALEDMDVSSSSPYSDDATDVMELYECQIGRVQSLADAWALDVTFEVPSQHKDEILKVLAENNEGGTNKYLTRYDELYPQAAPQEE